jgi:YegS/Rv2252/BmrU family lipid kinase
VAEQEGAYVFILNPRSAAGATRRRFERVRARFQSALPDMQVRLTERPDHATLLAREAVRAGAAAVIAVGGDGTNNEVINGFFDEDGERIDSATAFGVVTSGTGGDFRRTFGWGTDPEQDLRRIERGARRRIDVGRVRYTRRDGSAAVRCFVNIASFGMSGAIVDMVNAGSKALGAKGSFLTATVRNMMSYKPPRVRLVVDDGAPEELAVTTVAVASGQYFGGGMWIAPAARADDGSFELVIIRAASVAFWLKHGLKIYNGAHRALPEVSSRACRSVRAEPVGGAEVLLELDGELPGRLPASFEVLPGAVELIA